MTFLSEVQSQTFGNDKMVPCGWYHDGDGSVWPPLA